MKTRIAPGLVALMALTVMVAAAASVDGKWIGTSPGRDGKAREMTFNFKTDGANLTGTVSNRMGDREISEGKVAGDEISFVVKFTIGDREMRALYKGKVAGDEIQFTVQRGERSSQMTARRVR